MVIMSVTLWIITLLVDSCVIYMIAIVSILSVLYLDNKEREALAFSILLSVILTLLFMILNKF